MMRIFKCRRSSLALIAIAVLGVGLFHGIDTSLAIATVVSAVAGANAYEKKANNKEIPMDTLK